MSLQRLTKSEISARLSAEPLQGGLRGQTLPN